MRRLLGLASAVLIVAVLTAPQSTADPGAAHISSMWAVDADRVALSVFSPAMGRDILVHVQDPSGLDQGPALYLLDGSEAASTESGWSKLTSVHTLARSHGVTVVLPVGGPHSYYTDWSRPDPIMGTVKWETFLIDELPPIIDSQFGGDGRRAIAGASMGGLGALTLAARHPNFYRGVAAYSSCPQTADPLNQRAIAVDVARGGGNVENMWGPFTDRAWAEHDPSLLVANLRDTIVYLSASTGLPGRHNDAIGQPVDTAIGGVVESAASHCTTRMADLLAKNDVDVTASTSTAGTHRWEYWNDELLTSWPILMASLGAK